jgi:hypothetical protein
MAQLPQIPGGHQVVVIGLGPRVLKEGGEGVVGGGG